MAAKVKPSVVRLVRYDDVGLAEGAGTGFYVTSTGRLVTNHHMIEDVARLAAVSPDGTERAVLGVLARDEVRDLALLQVEGSSPSFLDLGSSMELVDGVKVHVYGNPLGLSWTLSTGMISAITFDQMVSVHNRERRPGRTLQVSASMMGAGNSGSPVFDANGSVLGVIYGGVGQSGGIGFAVPVEAVKDLVANAGDKPLALDASLGGFVSTRTRNLIISAIFFVGLVAWFGVQALRGRKHRSF